MDVKIKITNIIVADKFHPAKWWRTSGERAKIISFIDNYQNHNCNRAISINKVTEQTIFSNSITTFQEAILNVTNVNLGSEDFI
ncbi:MAG: hypothetical protein IPH93_16935 [Saprospiraceae bacterium]|nr:hypothetical protein [Saprospiraceae bacterium]